MIQRANRCRIEKEKKKKKRGKKTWLVEECSLEPLSK
jgi:hypothetical protein